MKNICISGQMASGKNVVGEYICDKTQFELASFAKPVKDIFCQAFDVDQEFIEKWKRKDEIPEGFSKNIRKSLQFIGNGFREIKDDVWVSYAMKNNPEHSCYTDGRYINELKKIKENRGINILLWRPGHENNDTSPSESQIKFLVDWFIDKKIEGDVSSICHKSNSPFDYIDYFLINDSTIANLHEKIDSMIISNINQLFDF